MDENLAVLTTKKIIVALEPITLVVHDEDGEWQFLGDSDASMEDLLIVSLQQIIEVDVAIKEVLIINRGHEAKRLDDYRWRLSKIKY